MLGIFVFFLYLDSGPALFFSLLPISCSLAICHIFTSTCSSRLRLGADREERGFCHAPPSRQDARPVNLSTTDGPGPWAAYLLPRDGDSSRRRRFPLCVCSTLRISSCVLSARPPPPRRAFALFLSLSLCPSSPLFPSPSLVTDYMADGGKGRQITRSYTAVASIVH